MKTLPRASRQALHAAAVPRSPHRQSHRRPPPPRPPQLPHDRRGRGLPPRRIPAKLAVTMHPGADSPPHPPLLLTSLPLPPLPLLPLTHRSLHHCRGQRPTPWRAALAPAGGCTYAVPTGLTTGAYPLVGAGTLLRRGAGLGPVREGSQRTRRASGFIRVNPTARQQGTKSGEDLHLGPTTRRQETTAGTSLERVGAPRTRRGESPYGLTSRQLGHSAGPQQYRQGGVAWRRLGSSGRLRVDKEWKVAAGSPPVHHWPRRRVLASSPPSRRRAPLCNQWQYTCSRLHERSDRVDQTSPLWWAHLVPGPLYLLQMRIHPTHRPPSPNIFPVALDIAHRPS